MKQNVIRQGDLAFIPMEPSNAEWVKRRYKEDPKQYGFRENGIIQEGEATGHHHKIKNPALARLFRPQYQNATIITGRQPVEVEHDVANNDPEYIAQQKHGDVTLDPDTVYEVKVARELAPGDQQTYHRVVD